jgi:hypothetical protein
VARSGNGGSGGWYIDEKNNNNGIKGTAKGGVIFVNASVEANMVGMLTYVGNRADDSGSPDNPVDNNNVYGTIKQVSRITVSATGTPSRIGPQTGTFTISRGTDSTGSLTVNFNLSGTAVLGNNNDYTIEGNGITITGTKGTAIIPAGQDTITFTIIPTTSNTPVPSQTVQVTLAPGDDYIIGTSDSARLTIDGQVSPTWLILLYIAADDIQPTNNDSRLISLNDPARDLISRLGTLPQNPAMRLVVLFDGNGTTDDSRIYLRQPGDSGLTDITETLAGSNEWPGFPYDYARGTSELDTGRTSTMRNFIVWARQTYPDARYTMLSIINHGGGWSPDVGSVSQPSGGRARQAGGWRGMSQDYSFVSSLSTRNTGEVFAGLGDLGEFDIMFFDACLMGMIESAYEVQPYTDYFIAGQNLLWAALPYETYLADDTLTHATTPRDLATGIVQHYNADLPEPYTIAAMDTRRLPDLRRKINDLAEALLAELDANASTETRIRAAYTASQKFDYNVNMVLEPTEGYVDLADFARHLKSQALSPQVTAAADAVIDAIGECTSVTDCLPNRLIIAFKQQSGEISTGGRGQQTWDFSNAHGVSIYLPLGEQDCRPTGAPLEEGTTPDPDKVCKKPTNPETIEGLLIERQLYYYTNSGQLTFVRDAPAWAELLENLEDTTPALAAEQRFYSPFPLRTEWQMFMPLMTFERIPPTPDLPDLIVSSVDTTPAVTETGTPAEVRITIRNIGPGDITKPFWVDLYIDPREVPQPNRIWTDISTFGAAWRVYGLKAGESRTLSTLQPNDPRDPDSRYSNFATFAGNGTIYVLVDSFTETQASGVIEERNEDNNLFGPVAVTISGNRLVHEPVLPVLLDPRSGK